MSLVVEVDKKRFNKLMDTFQSLGGELNDSPEIKSAIKSASQYVVKAEKAAARSAVKGRSVTLVKSPSYKLRKKNGGSLVGFRKMPSVIQAGGSKRAPGVPWWLDGGTAERYTKKGYYRGRVAPTYFWSSIREDKAQTAMDMISDGVQSAIDKIIGS